jgi:hypothetical protein
MSRAILVADVRIVAAALVGVANQDGDACAGRPAVENTGQDFRFVFLLTLGHEQALAWSSSLQVWSQVVNAERHSGGNTVDDNNITWPVALAGGCDAKQFSEGVAGHEGSMFWKSYQRSNSRFEICNLRFEIRDQREKVLWSILK